MKLTMKATMMLLSLTTVISQDCEVIPFLRRDCPDEYAAADLVFSEALRDLGVADGQARKLDSLMSQAKFEGLVPSPTCDDFETYYVPPGYYDSYAIFNSQTLDYTSEFESQSNLVNQGATYVSTGNRLVFVGDGFYGLQTQTITSADSSIMEIIYDPPVMAMSVDLHAIDGHPSTAIMEVFASDGVTLVNAMTGIQLPDTNPVFVGYSHPAGIGKVVLLNTRPWSPIIDNHCYGDVVTPVNPGGGGDPHMKTWNGVYYDYHGACDLVMLSDPFFGDNDMGLEVHMRTTIQYDFSFIESVAVKIGESVLEVSSYGDYTLDGISAAEMPAALSENLYLLTHTPVSDKEHLFEIVVDEEKNHKIIIKTFKNFVSVSFNLPLPGSVGMLGKYSTGDKLARDGTTVIDDAIEFGAEWQVRETEPKLFMDTTRYPQQPQACLLPQPKAETHRRLGDTLVTKFAAEEACAHLNNRQDQEHCVYDVMATNDLDMAQAGAI